VESDADGDLLILDEGSIRLSLVQDEKKRPTSALAAISWDAEVTHVTDLCKAFRDLGWTL